MSTLTQQNHVVSSKFIRQQELLISLKRGKIISCVCVSKVAFVQFVFFEDSRLWWQLFSQIRLETCKWKTKERSLKGNLPWKEQLYGPLRRTWELWRGYFFIPIDLEYHCKTWTTFKSGKIVSQPLLTMTTKARRNSIRIASFFLPLISLRIAYDPNRHEYEWMPFDRKLPGTALNLWLSDASGIFSGISLCTHYFNCSWSGHQSATGNAQNTQEFTANERAWALIGPPWPMRWYISNGASSKCVHFLTLLNAHITYGMSKPPIIRSFLVTSLPLNPTLNIFSTNWAAAISSMRMTNSGMNALLNG